MRGFLVMGACLAGFLFSGSVRADRSEKICRELVLDWADPWAAEIAIKWEAKWGCAEVARTRIRLEQGDPWRRAGGPTDPQPWNSGNSEELSPSPRLMHSLDRSDPWARLRPRAPSLRWPGGQGRRHAAPEYLSSQSP